MLKKAGESSWVRKSSQLQPKVKQELLTCSASLCERLSFKESEGDKESCEGPRWHERVKLQPAEAGWSVGPEKTVALSGLVLNVVAGLEVGGAVNQQNKADVNELHEIIFSHQHQIKIKLTIDNDDGKRGEE